MFSRAKRFLNRKCYLNLSNLEERPLFSIAKHFAPVRPAERAAVPNLNFIWVVFIWAHRCKFFFNRTSSPYWTCLMNKNWLFFYLLFQEQPLGGWVVRSSHLDSPELFFQIPPSYILAGGNTLTVSTRMHLIHTRTYWGKLIRPQYSMVLISKTEITFKTCIVAS